MGYYADLINEKRNSKYSYKLIDKGYYGVRKEEEYHKWVVQTWYGTKLVDEQEVTGPKSKAEAQGQKNVSAFERRYPENSKEEKGYYAKLAEEKEAKRNALEPVKRAEQLAREGKQYAEIVEAIKKEYNLPTDKAARAADQGKRNYELNPVNGEHKKPAKL